MSKLKSPKGFTLTEMLLAVAIMALACAMIATIIPLGVRAFREITLVNESEVLYSTLQNSLSAELRRATEAEQTERGAVWTSERFGMTVYLSPQDDEGVLKIQMGDEAYDLVQKSAYTNAMRAGATVEYDGGIFAVTLTITDGEGEELRNGTFHVRPLNG